MDDDRSAAPCTSSGTAAAKALSALPPDARVAIDSPAANVGRRRLPAVGQPPGAHARRTRPPRPGRPARRRRRAPSHSSRRRGARRPDLAGPRGDLVGHEELRVLGPAVGALGGGDLLGAERRAVRASRCPACWASRSRCGCGRRSGSAVRRARTPRSSPRRWRRGRCRPPPAAPASRSAAKRVGTSSPNGRFVGPSRLMWLSSQIPISRSSPRKPAIEAASCEMPSIRSPSEQMNQVRWSTTSWPGRL